MTRSRKLVEDVLVVARNLGRAAVWNGCRRAVDAASDDYVYELLCYFHIAAAAKKSFELRVAGRLDKSQRGEQRARWPKKAGLKKNFTFLSLCTRTQDTERFQLCPGIRIVDKHGKARAPDASLLCAHAPDMPAYTHLRACWDAKYTERPEAPLSDVAVADFIHTFNQFGSPKVPSDWTTAMMRKAFAQSGVVTNADASTEPDATLKEAGISETHRFPKAPLTRP